jgi:hypothetical protein
VCLALSRKHYAKRTEDAAVGWITRSSQAKPPEIMQCGCSPKTLHGSFGNAQDKAQHDNEGVGERIKNQR